MVCDYSVICRCRQCRRTINLPAVTVPGGAEFGFQVKAAYYFPIEESLAHYLVAFHTVFTLISQSHRVNYSLLLITPVVIVEIIAAVLIIYGKDRSHCQRERRYGFFSETVLCRHYII